MIEEKGYNRSELFDSFKKRFHKLTFGKSGLYLTALKGLSM
jgi:hypothetical protein